MAENLNGRNIVEPFPVDREKAPHGVGAECVDDAFFHGVERMDGWLDGWLVGFGRF